MFCTRVCESEKNLRNVLTYYRVIIMFVCFFLSLNHLHNCKSEAIQHIVMDGFRLKVMHHNLYILRNDGDRRQVT